MKSFLSVHSCLRSRFTSLQDLNDQVECSTNCSCFSIIIRLFQGTSWLFNAVRLLLIHEKSAYGPADSYRLNHITKNDIETRLLEAEGRPLVVRTMRIPDSDWAENLDRNGHGYTVFVSHRDLRDVIDDCLKIGTHSPSNLSLEESLVG